MTAGRNGTGRSAWQAAALIVVYLAATASASLHLATQVHVICPIHGELMHVGPGQSDLELLRRHPDPVAWHREGGVRAFGHEHCLLDSHRPGNTIEAAPPAQATRAAPFVLARAWPTRPAPVLADLTLLAPKQSPPVA